VSPNLAGLFRTLTPKRDTTDMVMVFRKKVGEDGDDGIPSAKQSKAGEVGIYAIPKATSLFGMEQEVARNEVE